MKTGNKQSDIKKLQLRKEQLKKQLEEQGKILDTHFTYLQQNIGSLAVNTVMGSVKQDVPPFLGSILGMLMNRGEEKTASQTTKSGKIWQILSPLLPLVKELVVPILMGMAVKAIKKKFLDK